MALLTPATRPRPKRLSELMDELQVRYEKTPVTLGELIIALKGVAHLLLVIFLTLPFVTPIPLPGLSTPFGFAIAFLALRLCLGRKPWFPRKLRDRTIPSGFFGKVFTLAIKMIRVGEKLLKPRWEAITSSVLLLRLHASLLLLAALALLIPLPIPFTNTFPSWAILFVAAGLMERDGLAIVLGYITFSLGILYFVVLGDAAARLMKQLLAWL